MPPRYTPPQLWLWNPRGAGGGGGRGGGGRGAQTSSAHAKPVRASISEAEQALEAGERKQRMRELPKARALFIQSMVQLATAGLASDRSGCLVFAAASAALLEVEEDEARIAAFGQTRTDGSVLASSSWRTRQMQLLSEAMEALVAGAAAAARAQASPDELSHLSEQAGGLQLLLSQAHEEIDQGPSALAAAERAVAMLDEAQRLHSLATEGAALLAEGPVAAEPSVDLMRALAPALMTLGRLSLQAADAQTPSSSPLRAQGVGAVERSLALIEEACTWCDSERGDNLPLVVEEWARLLLEASALVPAHSRDEILKRAAAKCADSLGLVGVPLAATASLLGDALRAGAENLAAPLLAALVDPSAHSQLDDDGGLKRAEDSIRLYVCAVSEGYEKALAVSSTDIEVEETLLFFRFDLI